MFDKIKIALFGEPSPNNMAKKIKKSKKLTVEQKFKKTIEIYKNYFATSLMQDANMATYELHYEYFMDKKDNKHQWRYKECFNLELQNLKLVNVVSLIKDVTDLLSLGLEPKNLSKEEQLIIYDLKLIKREVVDKSDSIKMFYQDNNVRNVISSSLDSIIDNILKLKQQENLIM